MKELEARKKLNDDIEKDTNALISSLMRSLGYEIDDASCAGLTMEGILIIR